MPLPKPALSNASLPNGLKYAVVAAVTCLIALISFEIDKTGPLSQAETFLSDFAALASRTQPPIDSRILVIKISDKTLDQFVSRSPIDRVFLAGLLTQLIQKHVRAIGLDILLDRPTTPASDAALKSLIAAQAVPISVAYVSAPWETTDEAAYENQMVPVTARADASLNTDWTGMVRSVPAKAINWQGEAIIPGLAYKLAADIGVQPPPGCECVLPLQYPRLKNFVLPILQMPAEYLSDLPESYLKDRIVLIGGNLQITDRWQTPYREFEGAYREGIPGVLIHAIALNQLLAGDAGPRHSAATTFAIILVASLLGAIITMSRMSGIASIGTRALALVILPIFLIWIATLTRIQIPVVGAMIGFILNGWANDAWAAARVRTVEFTTGRS